MAKVPRPPDVYVGVALIKQDGKILLVYNDNWGSFTLPMSKRRPWGGADEQGNLCEEAGVDAAARAAGEWLGTTFEIDPHPLAENIALIQSDRNGVWNNYHFEVFELKLRKLPSLVDGAVTEWLTPREVVNHKRRPISPTARHLFQQLLSRGLL